MSKEIVTEVIAIRPTDKVAALISGEQATKCTYEKSFFTCPHLDIDSWVLPEGSHGEVESDTKVGLCRETEKPCLKSVTDHASSMVE